MLINQLMTLTSTSQMLSDVKRVLKVNVALKNSLALDVILGV